MSSPSCQKSEAKEGSSSFRLSTTRPESSVKKRNKQRLSRTELRLETSHGPFTARSRKKDAAIEANAATPVKEREREGGGGPTALVAANVSSKRAVCNHVTQIVGSSFPAAPRRAAPLLSM